LVVVNLLHQPIEARAFRPAWGHEWIVGTLTLNSFTLRFDGSSGALEIPLHQITAEVKTRPGGNGREGEGEGEGGEEEVIVFQDRNEPGLEIVATELELLDCPLPPLQRARHAWAERLSRGEMGRRWKILGWFAVACVVVTLVGSMALSFMVRAIAARVPAEWDATFGSEVLDEMAQEETFLQDSNAVAQVAALAEPLLRVLPRQSTNHYQFHLVSSDDPNAFALPGNHVVITTAMLEMADAEELLGVLAHEMAHVTERHVYREIVSTTGPLMICNLFFRHSGGLGGLASGGAGLLISAGFSQEYETEADDVGWNYLVKANINPQGMIRLFEKLKAHEEKEGIDIVPQAFHSHPATAKRIRVLEKRWAKLRRQGDFIELLPVPKVTAVPGKAAKETPAEHAE
jgi:Zn-dependent protease with chaperone function